MFLLNNAVNKEQPVPTPAPEPAGEYKVVRCFQVPRLRSCDKFSTIQQQCELTTERECFLFTYSIIPASS